MMNSKAHTGKNREQFDDFSSEFQKKSAEIELPCMV